MARDHTEGVLPVPIPNTVVKTLRADDTLTARSWESRSLRAIITPFLLHHAVAVAKADEGPWYACQAMNLDPQWIVGFVDGEGCFYIGIKPQSEMTAGYQILPEFTVVQHQRDVQLLHALKAFFACGVVRTNHGDRMAYRVRDAGHLRERIIPFFEKHPLKTKKNIDFQKFKDVLRLMDQEQYLTTEGVERIRSIASTMNTGRPPEDVLEG